MRSNKMERDGTWYSQPVRQVTQNQDGGTRWQRPARLQQHALWPAEGFRRLQGSPPGAKSPESGGTWGHQEPSWRWSCLWARSRTATEEPHPTSETSSCLESSPACLAPGPGASSPHPPLNLLLGCGSDPLQKRARCKAKGLLGTDRTVPWQQLWISWAGNLLRKRGRVASVGRRSRLRGGRTLGKWRVRCRWKSISEEQTLRESQSSKACWEYPIQSISEGGPERAHG